MPLFGGPPNIEKLKKKRNVQALIKALGYTQDWTIRSQAALALGEIGDPQAILPLITALEDVDIRFTRSVGTALSQLADSNVEPFIDLLKHHSSSVRKTAVVELKSKRDARAVEPLISVLQDANEDNSIRRDAAEALGRFGDSRAVDPLIKVLQIEAIPDSDIFLRVSAIEALGKIGDTRAADTLAAKAQMPVEARSFLSQEFTAAAFALSKLGDVRAIEALINGIDLGKSATRTRVQKSLQTLGDSAIELLLEALQRNDVKENGKRVAVEALRVIYTASETQSDIKALILEASKQPVVWRQDYREHTDAQRRSDCAHADSEMHYDKTVDIPFSLT